MKLTAKHIYRLVLLGLFGLYLIFIFTRISSAEHLEFSTTHVPKYTGLFFGQTSNNLELSGTYLSKNRNPISNYDVNKKYDLVVYQIDLANDVPLNTILATKAEQINHSSYNAYNVINESLFEIKCKEGKPMQADRLFLKYEGESLDKIIMGDSVAYYNLSLKKLSLQYQEDEVDLLLEAKEKWWTRDRIPLSVLFLKRQRAVYLFLLSPEDKSTTMDKELLYRLIMHRDYKINGR